MFLLANFHALHAVLKNELKNEELGNMIFDEVWLDKTIKILKFCISQCPFVIYNVDSVKEQRSNAAYLIQSNRT